MLFITVGHRVEGTAVENDQTSGSRMNPIELAKVIEVVGRRRKIVRYKRNRGSYY
jgi:hypothetical protein